MSIVDGGRYENGLYITIRIMKNVLKCKASMCKHHKFSLEHQICSVRTFFFYFAFFPACLVCVCVSLCVVDETYSHTTTSISLKYFAYIFQFVYKTPSVGCPCNWENFRGNKFFVCFFAIIFGSPILYECIEYCSCTYFPTSFFYLLLCCSFRENRNALCWLTGFYDQPKKKKQQQHVIPFTSTTNVNLPASCCCCLPAHHTQNSKATLE